MGRGRRHRDRSDRRRTAHQQNRIIVDYKVGLLTPGKFTPLPVPVPAGFGFTTGGLAF